MMFKILPIHGKFGVAHTINYIGDGASPAHTTTTEHGHLQAVPKGTPNAKRVGRTWYLPNENGIYHRNLAHWGINMAAADTQIAGRDVNAIIRQHPHKLRGLQLIISPQNKLHVHDPDQIYRFQQFVTGVTKELYGYDYASYCAIQADNTHGIMHAHVITANTNMRNHKSLRGHKYSVKHINKVIDHQIDLDNQRYPGHPIFTKHNIATNGLEAFRSQPKDSPNLQLIDNAVDTVLKPGFTAKNKRGQKRIIASNNTFKMALKQQGVEPYFKRHRIYYHDRNGKRIPVVNHGKLERTKKGAVKYKYYLRHGLVYRIISDKKHNRKFNASDVAKRYPSCSYHHVHATLHRNYVDYLKKHARVQYDVRQTIKRRKPSAAYQRLHVYHPNDVRDVLPNLRNPVKHALYNDLNEIEPVMAVKPKQGQYLKRTQHLYITQPNTMEHNMIQHYRTNLFNRLQRRYEKLKKRTAMYKTALINSFKNEAVKAGNWLQSHHLGTVGRWVNKTVTQPTFRRSPLTVSNQLAAQSGDPYSKNVELAKRIEARNRRILNKPAVTVNNVLDKPVNIKEMFHGLHSIKAKRAFYINISELVPMLITFKYHKLGVYSSKLLNLADSFAGNDQYLADDYFHTLASRANHDVKATNNPVFNKYPKKYQTAIKLQQLLDSDLKEARPILNEIKPVIKTPLGTHSHISDMTLNKYLLLYGMREGNTKLYDNNQALLQKESETAKRMDGNVLIHDKPILQTYRDDLNNYRKAKFQQVLKENEITRRHEDFIRRQRKLQQQQQPQLRPHHSHPHLHDDGPTLG